MSCIANTSLKGLLDLSKILRISGLPIIPVLGRLSQVDHEFEVKPGYIVRLSLKKEKSQHH
jgi:hypothetical protein